jgi:hypothetical protein
MSLAPDFRSLHDQVVAALGNDEVITLEVFDPVAKTYTATPSRAVVSSWKTQDIIVGSLIQQGDLRCIISASHIPAGLRDLDERDRIVVRGRQMAVVRWDTDSRRQNGHLIAAEATVRGR